MASISIFTCHEMTSQECQKLRVKLSWQPKVVPYLAHPCRGAHAIASDCVMLPGARGSLRIGTESFLHADMDCVPSHGTHFVA